MEREALKLALEALTIQSDRVTEIGTQRKAITSLRQAIAKLESQEPVAQYSDIVSDGGLDPRNKFDVPPQRTWVGLTDDDEIPWDGVDAKSFARAIEAKLKEKNNGT